MQQLHAIAFKKPQTSRYLSPCDKSQLFWWVEISTSIPRRTHYFGPFVSQQEAYISRSGYVKEFYQQETGDIVAVVKQCQPEILTICQEVRV